MVRTRRPDGGAKAEAGLADRTNRRTKSAAAATRSHDMVFGVVLVGGRDAVLRGEAVRLTYLGISRLVLAYFPSHNTIHSLS
jgi:hypothetical protein